MSINEYCRTYGVINCAKAEKCGVVLPDYWVERCENIDSYVCDPKTDFECGDKAYELSGACLDGYSALTCEEYSEYVDSGWVANKPGVCVEMSNCEPEGDDGCRFLSCGGSNSTGAAFVFECIGTSTESSGYCNEVKDGLGDITKLICQDGLNAVICTIDYDSFGNPSSGHCIGDPGYIKCTW